MAVFHLFRVIRGLVPGDSSKAAFDASEPGYNLLVTVPRGSLFR